LPELAGGPPGIQGLNLRRFEVGLVPRDEDQIVKQSGCSHEPIRLRHGLVQAERTPNLRHFKRDRENIALVIAHDTSQPVLQLSSKQRILCSFLFDSMANFSDHQHAGENLPAFGCGILGSNVWVSAASSSQFGKNVGIKKKRH
ncbi:MAG TPA: hypothetical protein VN939_11235, partial [Chthoniobacterales bacterium]|nr:hypothetical protein [Chthoniobacterales bacterium]